MEKNRRKYPLDLFQTMKFSLYAKKWINQNHTFWQHKHDAPG